LNKATQTKTITDGVTLEWLDDEQIAVFTLTSVKRDSLDLWVEATMEIASTWDRDKPCLIMHDSSKQANGLTPYMRARLKEFDNLQPNTKLSTSIAIILPSSPFTHLVTLLLREYKTGPRIELRLFHRRSDGLKWLENRILK